MDALERVWAAALSNPPSSLAPTFKVFIQIRLWFAFAYSLRFNTNWALEEQEYLINSMPLCDEGDIKRLRSLCKETDKKLLRIFMEGCVSTWVTLGAIEIF